MVFFIRIKKKNILREGVNAIMLQSDFFDNETEALIDLNVIYGARKHRAWNSTESSTDI